MPKIKTAENDQTYHWLHCPGCDSHHAFSTCPTCKGIHRPPARCPDCDDKSWQFNFDYEKPTIRESILVNRGSVNPTAPVCHSFVTDGAINFLGDSTNGAAGKTIELPDVSEWPY